MKTTTNTFWVLANASKTLFFARTFNNGTCGGCDNSLNGAIQYATHEEACEAFRKLQDITRYFQYGKGTVIFFPYLQVWKVSISVSYKLM